MKWISIAILLLSLNAWSIRHVGTGAGEAELTIYRMAQGLELWAQACNENLNLCWQGGRIPEEFTKALPQISLGFTNSSEASSAQVILNSNDLYEKDEKTPRDMARLAEILVKGIARFIRWDLPTEVEIQMSPLIKQAHGAGIYFFKSSSGDVFVSPRFINLHQALLQKTQCSHLEYLTTDSLGFSIRCPGDAGTYRVYVREQASPQGSLSVAIRYEGSAF